MTALAKRCTPTIAAQLASGAPVFTEMSWDKSYADVCESENRRPTRARIFRDEAVAFYPGPWWAVVVDDDEVYVHSYAFAVWVRRYEIYGDGSKEFVLDEVLPFSDKDREPLSVDNCPGYRGMTPAGADIYGEQWGFDLPPKKGPAS